MGALPRQHSHRALLQPASTPAFLCRRDYEGKRSGSQGRFITDDPAKYPGRDNMFTGGWAGGEVGLKAFAAVRGRCR